MIPILLQHDLAKQKVMQKITKNLCKNYATNICLNNLFTQKEKKNIQCIYETPREESREVCIGCKINRPCPRRKGTGVMLVCVEEKKIGEGGGLRDGLFWKKRKTLEEVEGRRKR